MFDIEFRSIKNIFIKYGKIEMEFIDWYEFDEIKAINYWIKAIERNESMWS